MALLWGRAFRDEAALPASFGRVVRYRDVLPKRLRMAFEHLPSANANAVRANVYYIDEHGEVVLLMEDMECIASAALNRLGGTARLYELLLLFRLVLGRFFWRFLGFRLRVWLVRLRVFRRSLFLKF